MMLPRKTMLTFTKAELSRNSYVEFKEELEISPVAFQTNTRINATKKLKVKGNGYYEAGLDIFVVNAKISGIMLVPCAISFKEIEYPFHSKLAITYCFSENKEEDFITVKDETVELLPEIFQAIMVEVPLKLIAKDIDYPKGENWEVIKESDYLALSKTETDPRLAILKEYVFLEDEEE